jgi:RNA polymerase sigma factor (sigma-70 family)
VHETTTRTKWSLSAGGLDKLLGALCPDRETAGQMYETVRAGLLRFFVRRVGGMADTLVDETIDRVCHRVEDGEALERIGAFFYGVARNVLLEHLKTERRREFLRHEAARERYVIPEDPSPHDQSDSEKLACLQRCLGLLDREERMLIEKYYGVAAADMATVHVARSALASHMGITPGNLRVRAHRLRQRLEECCTRCLGGGERRTLPEEHDRE